MVNFVRVHELILLLTFTGVDVLQDSSQKLMKQVGDLQEVIYIMTIKD